MLKKFAAVAALSMASGLAFAAEGDICDDGYGEGFPGCPGDNGDVSVSIPMSGYSLSECANVTLSDGLEYPNYVPGGESDVDDFTVQLNCTEGTFYDVTIRSNIEGGAVSHIIGVGVDGGDLYGTASIPPANFTEGDYLHSSSDAAEERIIVDNAIFDNGDASVTVENVELRRNTGDASNPNPGIIDVETAFVVTVYY